MEEIRLSAVSENKEPDRLVESERRKDPVGPAAEEVHNAPNTSYAKGGSTNLLDIGRTSDVVTLKKSRTSSIDSRLQPVPHIVETFRQFIHNNIPVRLLDTTNLKFVERNEIFSLFSTQIAQITEEDVQKRMCTVEVDMYLEARKAALREIIRDVVRYAIFSHCWTDSEPTYQDVRTPGQLGSGKQWNIRTASFAKLAQLCDTARTLEYRFVWCDTCCIDKTDLIEPNEAIHAMFKWYAHAHLCIVHLGASSSLADFVHEPWFKRGWTLQELLAPRQIKFYDQAWHPFTRLVSDKGDPVLMNNVSAATGIPQDVITADNSRGIKGHAIWEIMSWTSSRKTTLTEDAAYCLFGLLDLHLPIIYGEGESAFPRLIEAIIAQNHTWDVFAWAGRASEQHPALPSAPTCYPKWDKAMTSGGVGMTEFALTPHGLWLTSVSLIPMAFVSESEAQSGPYVAMLQPQSSGDAVPQLLGMFSEVRVICDCGTLSQLRIATDLHVCILNYKPDLSDHPPTRGILQVGRKYICFLLHAKSWTAESQSTWLKLATDNVLYIACAPSDKTNAKYALEVEDTMFDLPLEKIFIRKPRSGWAA